MTRLRISPRSVTAPVAALVSAAALVLSACGAGAAPRESGAPDVVPARAAARPAITKAVVFVVENHSLGEMRRQMPRVYRFAESYAYATDYTAIRHPSLPNYLAMVSGSTLGVTDDASPSRHRLRAGNVFRQALAHHRTARVYADAMPRRCDTHNAGAYAVRHNAWTYFVHDRAACRRYDVPARRLAGDVSRGRLPNVGFVIPDLVHDAHDASLARADRWIARRIQLLRSGPDWASGHLAIILTADEDDSRHGNRVLTVVGSRYQPRVVVRSHLTHYSLSGLLSSVVGAPPLRQARSAPSMRAAFGIA